MLAEIYKEGAEFVKTCAANNTKLEIRGGASKLFYGELVMQVRAGTLVSKVFPTLNGSGFNAG